MHVYDVSEVVCSAFYKSRRVAFGRQVFNGLRNVDVNCDESSNGLQFSSTHCSQTIRLFFSTLDQHCISCPPCMCQLAPHLESFSGRRVARQHKKLLLVYGNFAGTVNHQFNVQRSVDESLLIDAGR